MTGHGPSDGLGSCRGLYRQPAPGNWPVNLGESPLGVLSVPLCLLGTLVPKGQQGPDARALS